MASFLLWLLSVELLSLAALPISMQVFRSLPDRGYIFAKPLGILLVAYLCWLLGVFGLLRFQQATIAAVLVALGAAFWASWGRSTLRHLASIRAAVTVSEALFMLCFALAALVRAFNPEISGTEKPMDFAFLNSIYRSEAFPSPDPWMSGFSISYYYFGYLLLAMLAKLSGVPAPVGYNLGVALVFALLLAGSYSLAFNLISLLMPKGRLALRLLGALAAPVLVGIMGNLEIVFEVLAVRGFGDTAFWNWAGIKGLQPASGAVEGWFPTSHWWWWRASRVIPTIKPDGINEFPFFSFLLGDLHPHFTSLPWALLAIALSLVALMERPSYGSRKGMDWIRILVPAVSLGFLLAGNSWDFPTYTGLFWLTSLATWATRDVRPHPGPLPLGEGRGEGRAPHSALRALIERLLLISILSVLLYSPFMLGFGSQVKGIGMSGDRTPLASMLIIFGPFLFVLTCFLGWRGWPPRAEGRGEKLRRSAWLLWGSGALLILASPVLGAISLLVGLLALAGAAFVNDEARVAIVSDDQPPAADSRPLSGVAARRFLLILVTVGLLLVVVPEFVFLNDSFGTRMNTVFKFHYQAWLLLGLSCGVALVWMAARMRSLVPRGLAVLGAALLVSAGLLYPLGAIPAKAQGFLAPPTLDGAAYYRNLRPDDYAAIQWLSLATKGQPVVLEATGGDYSEYARVSTFSGLPTVLGWAGHELQWRGSGEEAARRTRDIDAIYSTADRSAIMALLRKYHVRYVFVGSLEYERYGVEVTNRFEGLLDTATRQGRVVVYLVPGSS